MAVNKYVVAGGAAMVAVGVGAGIVYCRRDFAEAAASGDFERAERRAGLLAINDFAPAAQLTLVLIVIFVGLALASLTH